MYKGELLTLFNYNYWATGRILQAADAISPEQFTAPAQVSFGSLRGTLVHALAAENLWRRRCQDGVSPTSMLAEAEFPDVAALRSRWLEDESAMLGFLEGLVDTDLARVIDYNNMRGTPFETPLWQILLHVVIHSTQFRAEAGVALTNLGHSPGDIDLIVYLRLENQP